MDNPITNGFAPVQQGQLYYETAGGGPAVLLIHAGVADHTMWDAQMPAFTPHYRVIRYDARGFGRSRTESTSFSNRQDILDLLDHLKAEHTALIGISRGGQIALDFTLEHPERVSALILVAAGVSGFEFQQVDSEKAHLENQMFEQMESMWDLKDFEPLSKLEVQMWGDGPGQPVGRLPAAIRGQLSRMILDNYDRQDGEATAQPLEPPAARRLGEVKVPTLVMVGDLDTTGTLAMADVLASSIRGAHKELFTGAAHMLPMEQPEKFNRLVLDFLSNTASAKGD